VADVESDMEPDNSIYDPDSSEKRYMRVAENVPGLILTKWKSKRQAEKVLVKINAIETRTTNRVNKM